MKEMSAARKKRAVIALCLAFLCAFSACAVQRGRAKKAKKFTWLTMGTGDTGGQSVCERRGYRGRSAEAKRDAPL